MAITRRYLLKLAGSASALGMVPALVRAQQQLEKPKVHIAVGGKSLTYYLPLTIAERNGYFKDEGLDVTISEAAPMSYRARSSTRSTGSPRGRSSGASSCRGARP